MLTIDGVQYRNLQEQVLKNKDDIENIITSGGILDEFGIKVVGEINRLEDLPTVVEYKRAHPDWEYGDAYAVGVNAPYELYILTRANETITEEDDVDVTITETLQNYLDSNSFTLTGKTHNGWLESTIAGNSLAHPDFSGCYYQIRKPALDL